MLLYELQEKKEGCSFKFFREDPASGLTSSKPSLAGTMIDTWSQAGF